MSEGAAQRSSATRSRRIPICLAIPEKRIVPHLKTTGVETTPSCTSLDRTSLAQKPRSGGRTQPTACPEPVEGAQAVGQKRIENQAPKGAKENSSAITTPYSSIPISPKI